MKLKRLFIIPIAVALGTLSCQKGGGFLGKDIKLDSDEAKFSYAIGYEMGKNMSRRKVRVDHEVFVRAMTDAMGGEKEILSGPERRDILTKMSKKQRESKAEEAKKNLVEGEAFLEENKKKEGIKTTESGLQYEVLTMGSGEQPILTDSVEAHYKGTLIDGTVFDSSYERGEEPAEFPLRGVISGWKEALQLMNVGSKYKLYIPASLGYGPHGNSKIPGNSVLIFEVELLGIKSKGANKGMKDMRGMKKGMKKDMKGMKGMKKDMKGMEGMKKDMKGMRGMKGMKGMKKDMKGMEGMKKDMKGKEVEKGAAEKAKK